MQCMEVWGGNQAADNGVTMAGLDVWIYSKPYGESDGGGDVYYVSSCATNRITRLLVADVSGHGKAVQDLATELRRLMRRYVNHIDQNRFVRSMNEQFAALERSRHLRHRDRDHVLRADEPTDTLQRRPSAAAVVSRRRSDSGRTWKKRSRSRIRTL